MTTRLNRDERGVSLIEMVIVLVIIVIISGVIFSKMSAGRKVGTEGVGRQVARTYYEAALDYASDNGGQVPTAGGAEWPASNIELGPLNRLNADANDRYFRQVPEAIRDGRVRFVAGAASAGGATSPVEVTYATTGAQTFEVVATNKGTAYCHLTNGPTAATLPDC